MPKTPADIFAEKAKKILRDQYVLVWKRRTHTFRIWTTIMFFTGFMVAVAWLASRSGTFEKGQAATTQTFQASTDFSSTQGYKGWRYLEGATGNPLTYYASHAECGGQACWKGSESYQVIFRNAQHPGPTRESI